jgi:type I pantothenate kinase
MHLEIVSTDGFLHSNETLAGKGLSLRKGFPETYDSGLLSGTLQRARLGPVRIPGYSHITYDRALELDRTIDRPEIILVEGLGLSKGTDQRDPSALLDLLIYIDASEPDLEAWYVNRFMAFWREAQTNPASFYIRFRQMTEPEAEVFAHSIWTSINLPNLRDHITTARAQADLIVTKSADHGMRLSMPGLVDGDS